MAHADIGESCTLGVANGLCGLRTEPLAINQAKADDMEFFGLIANCLCPSNLAGFLLAFRNSSKV
jgi:hypothetical protein